MYFDRNDIARGETMLNLHDYGIQDYCMYFEVNLYIELIYHKTSSSPVQGNGLSQARTWFNAE